MWSLSHRTFGKLLADSAISEPRQPPGPERSRSASVLDAWLHAVIGNAGMRAFVQGEGELALRLLTTRVTDYQSRLRGFVGSLITEDLDAGRIRTEIPLEDLSYTRSCRQQPAWAYPDRAGP